MNHVSVDAPMKLILRNRLTLASSTKQKGRLLYFARRISYNNHMAITSSLYTKLTKDKSARIVLKQSRGPEGFKRKTQKTRVDVTIKRAQGFQWIGALK